MCIRDSLWVVDQSRYLRYEGVSFLQGVVVDVTETVELRNAMRMLVDHTLNDIVLVSWTDRAHARFEVIADGISRKCGCLLYTSEPAPWAAGASTS